MTRQSQSELKLILGLIMLSYLTMGALVIYGMSAITDDLFTLATAGVLWPLTVVVIALICVLRLVM